MSRIKIQKMPVQLGQPVEYFIPADSETIKVNDLIGKKIKVQFEGEIECTKCGRPTKKSFGQGFCFPCFRDAPENAECIVRPELCRGHLGEGRDPEWEEKYHNQPHTVYLALTDVVKVGVTRGGNELTRWIDQGAWKAIKLAEVPYRQLAGEIEVELKANFKDKTNWQRMLKGASDESVDLLEEKEEAARLLPEPLQEYISDDDDIYEFDYPVNVYPEKVKSINIDKERGFEEVLKGIRGQYLIFESDKVINLRKYSGYIWNLDVEESTKQDEQQTIF